jgi:hypothetical protein
MLSLSQWGTAPKNGYKMNLYQVRLFINNKWQVIRTYGTESEALMFAQLLQPEWDVKEVSVAEANQAGN